MTDFSALHEILILFLASLVALIILQRMKLPATFGYLLVGFLLGPSFFGWVQNEFVIGLLAELGLVLMLFSLGLKFSFPKLISLRKSVFLLGGMQIIFTSLILFVVLVMTGVGVLTSVLIASALAFSSTALVSKELVSRQELFLPHGQQAIGVLLFQDLVALFFLIAIPILGLGHSFDQLALALGINFFKGLGLFIVMLFMGRWLLPHVFHEIARTKSKELFVLGVFVIALLSAAIAHKLELSVALGAFIAGMSLSESRFRQQIDVTIEPFRDLMLGVFFMSIGMMLDWSVLKTNWYDLVLIALLLLLLKMCIISLLSWLLFKEKLTALRTGIVLAEGGEFGFVLLTLTHHSDLLSQSMLSYLLALIALSMLATPWLIRHSLTLARWISFMRLKDMAQSQQFEQAAEKKPTVILCGYGRVGQMLGRFLGQYQIPYLAIDFDPKIVQEASLVGESVIFGDVTKDRFLASLDLHQAEMVMISLDSEEDTLRTIHLVREQNERVPILVRTRDDRLMQEMLQAGANDVVPETFETGLMLINHVLDRLGVSSVESSNMIERVRAEHYQLLHGCYLGTKRDLNLLESSEKNTKFIHALKVKPSSSLLGQSIADLQLDDRDIVIQSVRRHHQTIRFPDKQFKFNIDDIVIFYGEKDRLKTIEELF